MIGTIAEAFIVAGHMVLFALVVCDSNYVVVVFFNLLAPLPNYLQKETI